MDQILISIDKAFAGPLKQYLIEENKNKISQGLLNELARLGIMSLNITQEYGGIELNACETAKIIQRIAYHSLGVAIFSSVHLMVANIINRYGSKKQKELYLPQMAEGKKLGAFCLSENNAGSDASNLKTTAIKKSSYYILNGSKSWITSAGFAGIYLVFAKTDATQNKNGISAFLIEPTYEGISFAPPEKKMGGEFSPIAQIYFNDCKVIQENLLGELNKGYKIALSALAGGRVNIAACAIGISEKAIELAGKHLLERVQFNQPLFNFQGLQFMIADMAIKLETSKAIFEKATQSLEQDSSYYNKRILPSIAKCYATDCAMEITTNAVQLFGAAGYTTEYEVESLMRGAKMLQIVEGTNQIQRVVIAKELKKKIETS